jgi:predicted MPP superfamily phosphohydrolase
MSDSWQPLKAGEIAVAHLSDLHFGSDVEGGEQEAKVWGRVEKFLNEDLRPHLLLVTGDLVHNPDAQLYKDARKALERVRPRDGQSVDYFVCRGNHDRHRLGNRVPRTLYRNTPWARGVAWIVCAMVGAIGVLGAALLFCRSAGPSLSRRSCWLRESSAGC